VTRRTSSEDLSIAHWLIYPVDPGLCVQRQFVKTEALLYRYIRSVLSTDVRPVACMLVPLQSTSADVEQRRSRDVGFTSVSII